MRNITPPVYSFDVFDTCISRTIDTPRNLFFVLGEKLLSNDIPQTKKVKIARDFVRARIDAEKRANRKKGRKKSAHFNEIYKNLKIPNEIHISAESIAKMELELEWNLSYAIKKTLDEVNQARKLKKKILFISDMYLDHNFIKSLLTKHDFFKEGDSLYVSSTYSHTKREGKLFDIVLDSEKIPASHLLHHGDDQRSDIISANNKGINAILIDRRWMIKDYEIFEKNLNLSSKCILNAIPRRIYLEYALSDNIEYKNFSLFSPLLVSFTLWVLEQAEKHDITCLYFLSRDSELPHKIAKIFSFQYKNLEIRYLYSSRDAWIKNCEKDEKKNLISYLNHEGLFSSKKWAIVDSGWALNNQKALQKIIIEQKISVKVNGFYFGLSNKRASYEEAGNGLSFSESDFYFAKKALVIESLLFPSNAQKTVAYQADAPFLPIFDKTETISPHMHKYSNDIHFFIEKYAEVLKELSIDIKDLVSYRTTLLKKFKDVIKNPDVDFLLTHAAHLIQKISFSDIYHLATKKSEATNKIVWIEACGKVTGKCFYFLARTLNFTNMATIKTKYIFKTLMKKL